MEALLKIARKVQSHFKDFYLAGGTAIMFRYKHRESYDLDFFYYKDFSKNEIIKIMTGMFNIDRFDEFPDNIDFYLENTRVSFVIFPFSNIEPLENFKGIIMASDYDIFLNKIYSAGRRILWKDPYDAAFLYKKYRWDMNRIKTDFERKFTGQSFEIFLGALLSFDDYPEIPEWVRITLLELKKDLD